METAQTQIATQYAGSLKQSEMLNKTTPKLPLQFSKVSHYWLFEGGVVKIRDVKPTEHTLGRPRIF